MDLHLEDRTVLVTGASKGIGLGIARCFAEEGARLRLVARSGDLLETEAAQLRAGFGVDVETLALDLATDADRRELMAAWPEVDVLVNNAGAIPAGAIDDVDDEALRAGWDLKVFGYVALTRFYLAAMKARGRGVIINVIGAAGERPIAEYIAGSMGNMSLMGMTLALGAESPNHGVRVVGVNPGPIATERIVALSRLWAEKQLGDPERYEEMLATSPFGRAGKVEEVASTVVFLASDRSGYTSGTIVTIDGGWANRPTREP
ncbi:MAG: short-chain dehydrogenase/reductase [Gammaproteobacteria bacterium]